MQEVQFLAEVFEDIKTLREEYGRYFNGKSKKAHKQEIRQLKERIGQKRSRLRVLRAKLSAKTKQMIAQGSDAGRELMNIYNKSMMVYRATKLLYQFFIATKPLGRNKALDQAMGQALVDINESIDMTYQNAAEVKAYFSEIAWNNYRNPQEGGDAIALLDKHPRKF